MTSRFHGHFWTIYPHVRALVSSPPRVGRRWHGTVEDPQLGRLRLSGEWIDVPEAREVAVVVHGLGGQPEGIFSRVACAEYTRRGVACLNLALRGADRSGEDIYHGGLPDDIEAALAAPELARFEHVDVLGFSMGGHAALHVAHRARDPRLRAVTAVCSPLQLDTVQRYIDSPGLAFYRRQVLAGLREIYRAFAERRPERVSIDPSELRKLATVRSFDEHVICPRWGFASPDAYYENVTIAPKLDSLRVPSLLVLARHDPMVPAHLVAPVLDHAGANLDVRWVDRGGHMGFPRGIDLGFGADLGLFGQTLAWARARAGARAGHPRPPRVGHGVRRARPPSHGLVG